MDGLNATKWNVMVVGGVAATACGSAPYTDGWGGDWLPHVPLLIECGFAGLDQPPCAYGLLVNISGERKKSLREAKLEVVHKNHNPLRRGLNSFTTTRVLLDRQQLQLLGIQMWKKRSLEHWTFELSRTVSSALRPREIIWLDPTLNKGRTFAYRGVAPHYAARAKLRYRNFEFLPL